MRIQSQLLRGAFLLLPRHCLVVARVEYGALVAGFELVWRPLRLSHFNLLLNLLYAVLLVAL